MTEREMGRLNLRKFHLLRAELMQEEKRWEMRFWKVCWAFGVKPEQMSGMSPLLREYTPDTEDPNVEVDDHMIFQQIAAGIGAAPRH